MTQKQPLTPYTKAFKEVQDAWASGRMHHAWLVAGPAGEEKKDFALAMVRLLFAGDEAAQRQIEAGSFAEMLVISRSLDTKTSRLRSEIVVADIKPVYRFLRLTAAGQTWRAVIIDGAEFMNRSAMNAILKILEEPPPRALIILTCAMPGRLLPTIRSRCRKLILPPLEDTQLSNHLRTHHPEYGREAIDRVLPLAHGSISQAVFLLRQEGDRLHALVLDVLRGNIEALNAYGTIDTILSRDEGFAAFMGLLTDEIGATITRSARERAPWPYRPGAARSLREWAELWQNLLRIREQTEHLNLDKRQTLLEVINLVGGT